MNWKKQQFLKESEKLMMTMAEDDELMWKSWEYEWEGKRRQAEYIDNRMRPITKAKVRQHATKVLALLEGI